MPTSSSPAMRQSPRLSRSANACQRCRRRKQKCDLRYPRCSSCEAAQVACLSYHVGKQAEVPRNYVSSLEAQVERLTKEMEDLRTRIPATPPRDGHSLFGSPTTMPVTPGPASSISATESSLSNQQELIKSMGLVVLEPSNQTKFLGTSSGVTLAKIVMASINCDIVTKKPYGSAEPDRHSMTTTEIKSSLPPHRVAEHLVDVYYECRTPHFPIMSRQRVLSSINNAYIAADAHETGMRKSFDRDMFVSYMIFAIGLCGLQNGAGERPLESEGCFHSAVQYIDSVITYSKSDVDLLAAILLLAQYTSLSPSKGSLWQLAGIALRICIDIGLHWETEAVLKLDSTQLDERRRLFWATYYFDRLLAITLGRPFGLVDQSLDVGYPNSDPTLSEPDPVTNYNDMHSQRAVNHLTSLIQLESEIKHALYHQLKAEHIAYPRPNYALWISDIQSRLDDWHLSIPALARAHPKSIYANACWWEAIFNNTLLLLHRPTPLIPHPTAESLRICFDASTRLIDCIRTLQRQHKLDIVWIWVHRLFIAGLTLMYTLWNSEEIRSMVPADDIINHIQQCSTTLAVLSERFPGAVGCRDAFETLATVTTRRLVASQLKAQGVDDTRELREHLTDASWPHVPRNNSSVDEIFSLLSNDMFMVGETLGTAAQWPVAMRDLSFPGSLS